MGVPPILRKNLTSFRRFGYLLPTQSLQKRNHHLNSKTLRCVLAREPRETGEVRQPGQKRKPVLVEPQANQERQPWPAHGLTLSLELLRHLSHYYRQGAFHYCESFPYALH